MHSQSRNEVICWGRWSIVQDLATEPIAYSNIEAASELLRRCPVPDGTQFAGTRQIGKMMPRVKGGVCFPAIRSYGLRTEPSSLYYRHRHPMTFLDALRSSRLVGILRGVEATELPLVADACTKSGLQFIEITLNTKEALSKIAFLSELSEGNFQVGAGTVLTAGQLRSAVDAGARFVVSPVLVDEVASLAAQLEIPYIPGALTPGEIWACHRAGAAVTKVFPIQYFGPSYMRELRGPFGDIPLLACGGVGPDNLREYLEAGVDAAALGQSTFRREWLGSGNTAALTEALTAMTNIVRTFNTRR